MGTIDYKRIYDARRDGWKEVTSPGNKKFENLFAGQYSENNHFIYELLQNAEDAQASFITFVYQENRLIVYHDGRPFTEEDVEAICSVMDGPKDKNDPQTIGHFGLGFKSVFKYTGRPEVYSNDNAFAIERYLLPVQIPSGAFPDDCQYQKGERTVRPFAGKENYTKFVLPFKDTLKESAIDPNDIPRKLRELEPEILLFLRHIQVLTWIDETTGDYGEYRRDLNIEASHSGEGTEYLCKWTSTIAGETRNDTLRYLVYKDEFPLLEMDSACVKLAFQLSQKIIKPVDDPKIWVFFPTTDSSGLKFLAHGTYQTPVSREKIVSDSPFNQELLRKTEDLFIKILPDLRDRKILTQSFLKTILLPAFDSPFFRNLREKAKTAFLEQELLPVYNSDRYCRACEARVPVPYTLPELVAEERLRAAIGEDASFAALKDIDNAGKYYAWLRGDLGISPWDLSDFAELLSNQNPDEFGGGEKILLLLTEAWKSKGANAGRGDHNKRAGVPDYYTELKSCFDQALAALKEKAFIPNQAGGYSPAWRWYSSYYEIRFDKYLYFKRKEEKKFLPEEQYVSLDAIAEDKRGDVLLFITYYFEIGFYELKDYFQTAIVPKYETEPLRVTDAEHVKDMQNIFLKCGPGFDVYVRIRGADGAARYEKCESDIWFETDKDGNSIRDYLEGLPGPNYFVDLAFYESYGITREQLQKLGMKGSLFANRTIPLYFQEALQYIETNQGSELSRKKSQIIWNLLTRNGEAIGSAAPITMKYRWVFDKNGNLTRTSDISQCDLDPALYKPLSYDSELYRCLQFNQDERNGKKRAEEWLAKYSDPELLELLQGILEQRGISYSKLVSTGESPEEAHADAQYEELEFPWKPVRNFEILKCYVEARFSSADPALYEKVMRSIHTSKNRENDGKSYLSDQYAYNGRHWCQLCHQPKKSCNSVQFQKKPRWDLEQMHLYLCYECAEQFRPIQRNPDALEALKNQIRSRDPKTLAYGPAKIPLGQDGTALWFSPVHLAEVKVLLELLDAEEGAVSDKQPDG